MKRFSAAAAFAALALTHAFAQTPCRGTALTGTVKDSTLALIPGCSPDAGRERAGDERLRRPIPVPVREQWSRTDWRR